MNELSKEEKAFLEDIGLFKFNEKDELAWADWVTQNNLKSPKEIQEYIKEFEKKEKGESQ